MTLARFPSIGSLTDLFVVASSLVFVVANLMGIASMKGPDRGAA
jgi:hypothetical protein